MSKQYLDFKIESYCEDGMVGGARGGSDEDEGAQSRTNVCQCGCMCM